LWRTELVTVEKVLDELWIGVKGKRKNKQKNKKEGKKNKRRKSI